MQERRPSLPMASPWADMLLALWAEDSPQQPRILLESRGDRRHNDATLMKLLPRFSLKTLFVVTTFVALLSLAVGSALSGRGWAVLVMLLVAAAGGLLVVHQAMFLLVWFLQRMLVRQDPDAELRHSPFATDQLPPQILEPTDRGVNG